MKIISGNNIKRLKSYIKRNGLKASAIKVLERLEQNNGEKTREKDVFDHICDKEEEEYERQKQFTHRYKFSIVVPAYETGERRIREMIRSVMDQTYTNWELCIADASETDEVEKAVSQLSEALKSSEDGNSGTVKYVRISENRGISSNTNEALKLAEGEYIAFMDHDDVLTKNALFEAMCVLENGLVSEGGYISNTVKMIYSDEDKCNDELTEFFDSHRKPDFDIDLLRSNNYICHLLIVRRELLEETGGFNSEYDGAQDHDFILRCVEKLKKNEIVHIDKILYHWRSHEKSTATNPESKLYAYDAGKRAVADHLKRLGIEAEVTDTQHLGFYRVRYKVTAEELTKIQIMSLEELKAMSKEDLKAADFEYIMVQNDNVKPVNYEYLEELLGILKREEVGCAGSLVIRKGKIESAGYSFGDNGELVPEFAGLNKNFSGYLHRAKLTREVDAVCTDCMMIKKEDVSEEGTFSSKGLVVYCPYSIFKRIR